MGERRGTSSGPQRAVVEGIAQELAVEQYRASVVIAPQASEPGAA